MKESGLWTAVLTWLIALSLPLLLLLSSIRLLMTPVYVDLAYSLPGLPADAYGMTEAERRQYAKVELEYLLNDEDISFLRQQKLTDGTPLHNERELGHMEDVKELGKTLLSIWMLLLAIMVVVVIAAPRLGFREPVRRGLHLGSQLTMGLIVAVLIIIALSFNWLFTEFHHVFFEGDSWLFQFSDSLIRMFPLAFFQNVFISIGVLTLFGAAVLWVATGEDKNGELKKETRKKKKA